MTDRARCGFAPGLADVLGRPRERDLPRGRRHPRRRASVGPARAASRRCGTRVARRCARGTTEAGAKSTRTARRSCGSPIRSVDATAASSPAAARCSSTRSRTSPRIRVLVGEPPKRTWLRRRFGDDGEWGAARVEVWGQGRRPRLRRLRSRRAHRRRGGRGARRGCGATRRRTRPASNPGCTDSVARRGEAVPRRARATRRARPSSKASRSANGLRWARVERLALGQHLDELLRQALGSRASWRPRCGTGPRSGCGCRASRRPAGPWRCGRTPRELLGDLRVPVSCRPRPSDRRLGSSTSARPAGCIAPDAISAVALSRLIFDHRLFAPRREALEEVSSSNRSLSVDPAVAERDLERFGVRDGRIPESFFAILIQMPFDFAWCLASQVANVFCDVNGLIGRSVGSATASD